MLGKLYAVLTDQEQRAVYDEQGVVDEESDVLRQDRCWEDYWRLLFPKVLEHFDIYVHINKSLSYYCRMKLDINEKNARCNYRSLVFSPHLDLILSCR